MKYFNKNFTENFPQKAPKIGIQKATDKTIEIELSGDPVHIASYDIGSEYTACDYDWPGERISQIIQGRTEGPVYFDGVSCFEMIELQNDIRNDQQILSRRLITQESNFSRTLMIHLRRKSGFGFIEFVNLETPRRIKNGMKWKVAEFDPDVDNNPRYLNQYVDGIYDLHVAKKTHKCLRLVRTREPEVDMEEAEEFFVSIDSGLTVLTRHYVGRGWPNIETFKKSPKIEVDGHIYYLWFIRRVMRDDTTFEL